MADGLVYAAEAVLGLLHARMRLARASFQDVLARAGFKTVPAAPGARAPADPRVPEIRRWVAAAARRLPGTTCLHQALAVHSMLERRSIPHAIYIGVRPTGSPPFVAAHSWIQVGATVASDVPDVTGFSVLAVFE